MEGNQNHFLRSKNKVSQIQENPSLDIQSQLIYEKGIGFYNISLALENQMNLQTDKNFIIKSCHKQITESSSIKSESNWNSIDDIKFLLLKTSMYLPKDQEFRLRKIQDASGIKVFRLLDKTSKQELIVQLVYISSSSIFERNQMKESMNRLSYHIQQLKHLHNDNPYLIPEVKEEIILYEDVIRNGVLIKSPIIYIAISEQAFFNLADIVKEWNKDNSKLKETFSEIQLTVYFYLLIKGVAYYNTLNYFIPNLNPQNVFVYRNHQVKLGNVKKIKFGIIKGQSPITKNVSQLQMVQSLQQKQQKTHLEKTLDDILVSIPQKQGDHVKIANDLKSSISIWETYQLWKEIFQIKVQSLSSISIQNVLKQEMLINNKEMNNYSSIRVDNSVIQSFQESTILNINNEMEISRLAQKQGSNKQILQMDYILGRSLSQEESVKQNIEKISQRINSRYEHSKQMPKCTEKYVYESLYYSSLLVINNQQDMDQIQNLSIQLDISFYCMIQQLKAEKRDSNHILQITKIIDACIKNQAYTKVFEDLQTVQKKVCPLDLDEMFYIIHQMQLKTEIVKDEDVVLLLGTTGVGKSTTIHYLAGSKMIYEINKNGLQHIKPEQVYNRFLDKVICNPHAKSETRYITPVVVNLKDIGSLNKGSIILCDSPGFSDNRGPEIDIANCYGLIQALKNCRSVRLVIVISEQWGDKMQGLQELSNVLVQMIKNLDLHLPSVSYLFSKFSEEQKQFLQPKLVDFYHQQQEKSEFNEKTPFIALIKDMIETAENDPIFIDPLNGHPKNIIDKILKKPSIRRPDEEFQFFITPKSQKEIQEQVALNQSIISIALNQQNYELVSYKLNQLKELNNYLDQDYIKNTYTGIINSASQNMQKDFQNAEIYINKCLEYQNQLTSEDLKNYLQKYQIYKKLEDIIQEDLISKHISSDNFKLIVQQRAKQLICDLKSNENITNVYYKQIILDKLQLISIHLDEFKDIYSEATYIVELQIEELIQKLKDEANIWNYYKIGQILSQLKQFQAHLFKHLDISNLKVKINDIKDSLLNVIKKDFNYLNVIVKNRNLTIEDITQCNKFISRLEEIKLVFQGNDTIKKQEVVEFHNEFVQNITYNFSILIEEIESGIIYAREHQQLQIKTQIQQIILFKEISSLSQQMNDTFFRTIEQVSKFFFEVQNDAEIIIDKLIQLDSNLNFDKLKTCLIVLEGSEWIQEIKIGIYQNIMNKINEKIMNYCVAITDQIKQFSLDISSHNQISLIYHKILAFNKINVLEQNFSGISQMRQELNIWFQRGIMNNLQLISNTYQIEKVQEQTIQDIELGKVESVLSYFLACNSGKVSQQYQQLTKVSEKFDGFISDYRNLIRSSMEKAMKVLARDDDKLSKEDLINSISVLQIRLKELNELSAKYPLLQSKLDSQNVIKYEYQKKLATFLNELRDQITYYQKANNNNLLMNKLLIAKQMSQLDEYLSHDRFIEIYREYQTLFFSDIPKLTKEALEAIEKYNFSTVLSALLNLDLNDELFKRHKQTIQNRLNDQIQTLCEETLSKTRTTMSKIQREVDPEKVEVINKLLNHLQSTHKVQDYLNKGMDETIKSFIERAQLIISKRMSEMIQYIDGLLNSWNFCEAEEKITNIELIHEILSPYCEEDLKEKVSNLTVELEQALRKLVNIYKDQDISNVRTIGPKEIFKRLEQNKNNLSYMKAVQLIETTLLEKFTNEIITIKDSNTSQYQKNKDIFRVETFVKYLPSKIKDQISEEIREAKQYIQDQQENLINNLRNFIKHKQLQNILEFYQDNKASDISDQQSKLISDFLKSQINELKTECTNILKEQLNFEIIFPPLFKILQYKQMFSQIFPGDVSQPFKELQQTIYKRIEQDIIKVNQFFEYNNNIFGLNSSNLSDSTLEESDKEGFTPDPNSPIQNSIRPSLDSTLQIIKQWIQSKDKTIELFPQIEDKFQQLLNIILTSVLEHQHQFDRSLNDNNMISLKHILMNMDKWNNFLMDIRQEIQKYSILDISMQNFCKAIQHGNLLNNMTRIISQKIQNITDEILQERFINELTNNTQNSREEYYNRLKCQMEIIKDAKVLNSQVWSSNMIDVKKAEGECFKSLQQSTDKIVQKASSLIKSHKMSRKECKEFSVNYENLKTIISYLEFQTVDYQAFLDTFNDNIHQKVQNINNHIMSDDDVVDIVNYIIDLKNLVDTINFEELNIDSMEITLKNLVEAKGFGVISRISQLLEVNNIGKRIIIDYKIFESFNTISFNKKTELQDINFVLNNIQGQNVAQDLLLKRYNDYLKNYDQLISQYYRAKFEASTFMYSLRNLIGKNEQKSPYQYPKQVQYIIPELIAFILALYTIQKYPYTQLAHDTPLFHAHPIQVISILRLLGSGDKQETLSNNLVEIAPGEGKSLIIAVVSSVLSLLGFDVFCACQSEYLCQRDYEAFYQLYNQLGVVKNIKYDTINNHCQFIINPNGIIQEKVEQFIFYKNTQNEKSQKHQRPRILLLDEVNVLFDNEFQGYLYQPITSLRDELIKNIIDYIWVNRNSEIDLDQVLTSQQYKNCVWLFQSNQMLLEIAVKNILSCLTSFEYLNYRVENDKIYIEVEEESNSHFIDQRYKTMLAYYKEHGQGRISKTSLNDHITILINSGCFSFVEVVSKFEFILGVTGTLKDLNKTKKEILGQQFKIMRNTFIPKLFTPNLNAFNCDTDFLVFSEERFYPEIVKEIKKRLKSKDTEKLRAVLVFFESFGELEAFCLTEQFKMWKQQIEIQIIRECSTLQEIQKIIKNSSLSGQVALMTKQFGKGTDFTQKDDIVKSSGGIHVIQTFLSGDIEEENQLKSRACYQGDSGSFSQLIKEKSLDSFQMNLNQFKKKDLYEYISQQRERIFEEKLVIKTQQFEALRKMHYESIQFLRQLYNQESEQVFNYLVQQNVLVQKKECSKTIILMESTKAMEEIINKMKKVISNMFQRVYYIMDSNELDRDSIQIQLACYRNYQETQSEIFQHSQWYTKDEDLIQFIDKIKALGGVGTNNLNVFSQPSLGNSEAVELGLWHANQEALVNKISQVILIGGSQSNTREKARSQRASQHGEIYWQATQFGQITDYIEEASKLKAKSIPVHAVYVEEYAKQSFEMIASLTKGKAQYIDIHSPQGQDNLIDTMAELVLQSVGKNLGIQENSFIDEYRQKFSKENR